MSLYDVLSAPFAHPTGWLGRVAARIMVATNGPLADLALDLAALEGRELVLEVGFGPGALVSKLVERLPRGRVVGVDFSPLMVSAAAARNAEAVARGAVELSVGSVDALPCSDAAFDRVITVNSLPFWPDTTRGLREIARVLRPGGRLVIVLVDHAARDHEAVVARRLTILEGLAGAQLQVRSAEIVATRAGATIAIVAERR